VHTASIRTGSCARFQIRWRENPLATEYQLESLAHAAINKQANKDMRAPALPWQAPFPVFSLHQGESTRRTEPCEPGTAIRDLGIGLVEVAIRLTKDGPLVAMDCMGMLKECLVRGSIENNVASIRTCVRY
jgi:hypothetical protein